MKRLSTHSLLAALGTALLVLPGTATLAEEAADPPDTSKWVCKLCPISKGWFGEWDLGLIYVDDPTPKFADYRGMLDDDWYILADGESFYRGENGYYFDFIGRNLGIESRRFDLRGGRQGFWELRGKYQEIPRYLGHGTVTPYNGVGSDTLTLPNDWRNSFAPAALESKRKIYGAGFAVKFGGNWVFEADVERQDRSGTKAFGGGTFAINGAWFPAPVDYTTDLIRSGLAFNADRGQIRLDYFGSKFENGASQVTWDNPFATGWGDEVSRSALEPDNKFNQLSLSGAYRFSRRFRISGKASTGKVTQNAAFLPYSASEEYENLPLPRSSLDGELETSMLNLAGRVYIVLADRLDLTAAWKTNERDNNTPIDTYTPVMLEVWPAGPRSNRPYSYERDRGWAELRWRPTYNVRLNGGIKRDKLERTFQEIEESEEDSIWGEIQFAPWAWLDARLKYESLDRDTSDHEQQGNYDRPENPLMRKFNMADRKRDRATVEVDLFPVEKLGISLSWYATEDDYQNSVIGLTSAEETSLSLDLNYAFGKEAVLYGFVTKDEIESEMAATPSTGLTPWNGFTEDEILTWGVGINGRFKEKWTYGIDYVSSEADGDILVDSGAGEAPFPVLTTSLTNARVYLKYRMNERWGLGVDAYREEYETADWFVDGYGPLDIPGLLTLGDVSPDYDVYVVRMMATLQF